MEVLFLLKKLIFMFIMLRVLSCVNLCVWLVGVSSVFLGV